MSRLFFFSYDRPSVERLMYNAPNLKCMQTRFVRKVGAQYTRNTLGVSVGLVAERNSVGVLSLNIRGDGVKRFIFTFPRLEILSTRLCGQAFYN